MIRGENVVCATSTTGTGTLTLAACPSPPGGIDFYNWATATGIGFTNGSAILVPYVIIEYGDSTFASAVRSEKGVGTLTLGASLTASTLARTTVQQTATGMNSTPTYSTGTTPITIVTAANVLVFIGASASDIMACPPYFEPTGYATGSLSPMSVDYGNSTTGLTTGEDMYAPFDWGVTMLVKKVSTYVGTPQTGGTSNCYGRLYDIATNGRPGRLLLDMGAMGTPNDALEATGVISSAAHSTGFLLTPGTYFMNFLTVFSGGSGDPELISAYLMTYGGCRLGFEAGNFPYYMATATGGNSTAPATANTTGYALTNVNFFPNFGLAPS